MAWELKKVEDQRKELVEAYFEGSITMKDLCDRFGISRKTAYKWLKRYTTFGLEGLKDRSRAPHAPRCLFEKEEVQAALDLKMKHKTWGPKKIFHKLKQYYPQKRFPSVTRLYEIFKDNHLITARRLKNRVPATHPLGTVNESNDTWAVDFKGYFFTQNKEKCEPFTITDSFSRYLIRCTHLNSKSVESVWAVLKMAFLEYGLPNRIRSDNGPPFASIGVARLSLLSLNLIKAGVIPEWINPGHPEENGRHERFHLTLKEDVADPPAATLEEQIWRMQRFQREYNFERPHEALYMQTPASIYCTSDRKWDGKLRNPEYSQESTFVRKVGSNGCIRFKKEYFIGQVLAREYISFRETDGGFEIYYGPVYLGFFNLSHGLKKPELKGQKELKTVTHVCE